MRRRASRAAAIVMLAVAGLVGLAPAPSSAEAPQATGYWSRRLPDGAPAEEGAGAVRGLSSRTAVAFSAAGAPAQQPPVPLPIPGGEGTAPVTTVPLPVPPPTVPELPIPLPEDPGPATPNPTVPDGGLWVANDPTGPVAVSALRFRGDIGAGELTLRFAPGTTSVGPMVACPTLRPFEPVEGGAWRDRPAHDCQRLSLTGRRTPDGTGMQFSIPQGFLPFGERVLDIVVLPDPTRGDPFSASFERPGDDALEVTAGQELPPPEPELPELDPGTLPEPVIEAPTFATPAVDVAIPPVTPAAPAEEASAPQVQPPSPVASVLEPLTESRLARVIAVSVLLAMGAGLWLYGGQPVREPRLLGAMAAAAPVVALPRGPAARGLGQFRRVREGRPGRL